MGWRMTVYGMEDDWVWYGSVVDGQGFGWGRRVRGGRPKMAEDMVERCLAWTRMASSSGRER